MPRSYPETGWVLLTIGSKLPEVDVPGEIFMVPVSYPKVLNKQGTNAPKDKRRGIMQVSDIIERMSPTMRSALKAYVDIVRANGDELKPLSEAQAMAYFTFVSKYEGIGWLRVDHSEPVPELETIKLDWSTDDGPSIGARVHIAMPFCFETQRLVEKVTDELTFARSLHVGAGVLQTPAKGTPRKIALALPETGLGTSATYTVYFGMKVTEEIIACSDGAKPYDEIGILSRNKLYDVCEAFFGITRNSLKGLMRAHRVSCEHNVNLKSIAQKFASLATFLGTVKENTKAYQTLKAAYTPCQLSKHPKSKSPRSKKEDDAAFKDGLELLREYVEEHGRQTSTKRTTPSASKASSSSKGKSSKKRKVAPESTDNAMSDSE